jgi:hypothetical protein
MLFTHSRIHKFRSTLMIHTPQEKGKNAEKVFESRTLDGDGERLLKIRL